MDSFPNDFCKLHLQEGVCRVSDIYTYLIRWDPSWCRLTYRDHSRYLLKFFDLLFPTLPDPLQNGVLRDTSMHYGFTVADPHMQLHRVYNDVNRRNFVAGWICQYAFHWKPKMILPAICFFAQIFKPNNKRHVCFIWENISINIT